MSSNPADTLKMADKKEGKEGKDLKDFTPREMEIMSKAWVCMVEEPKVHCHNITSLASHLHPSHHARM
jgi:hypothetical protein